MNEGRQAAGFSLNAGEQLINDLTAVEPGEHTFSSGAKARGGRRSK
jgi:hypothetical protein